MRVIYVDRCGKCPYREPDDVVADGTVDYCIKTRRFMKYDYGMKKHEFPKFCRLQRFNK